MKELNFNTIYLLRALVKLSSSLNEADDIMYSPLFRFRIKKELPVFIVRFEQESEDTMKLLASEDDDTLIKIIGHVSEYAGSLLIGDSDKRSLILFYSKIKSALNDLNDLDDDIKKTSHIPSVLIAKCTNMIKVIESQFSHLVFSVDKDGTSMSHIVDSLDKAGKEIMFLEEKTITDESN